MKFCHIVVLPGGGMVGESDIDHLCLAQNVAPVVLSSIWSVLTSTTCGRLTMILITEGSVILMGV